MVHIELADGIEELPFEAPIMNIARLKIKIDHVTQYGEIMEKHGGLLVEATKPYNAISTWRSDSEPGKHEAIVISGWESVKAHQALEEKSREWNKDAMNHIEGYEAFHARNMEK